MADTIEKIKISGTSYIIGAVGDSDTEAKINGATVTYKELAITQNDSGTATTTTIKVVCEK